MRAGPSEDDLDRRQHQDRHGDQSFTSGDSAEEGIDLNGYRQGLGQQWERHRPEAGDFDGCIANPGGRTQAA